MEDIQLPLDIGKSDPILAQTYSSLCNSTVTNGNLTKGARDLRSTNTILRNATQEIVQIKDAETITATIERLISKNVELNDLNNDMRSKNEELRNDCNTLACVYLGQE